MDSWKSLEQTNIYPMVGVSCFSFRIPKKLDLGIQHRKRLDSLFFHCRSRVSDFQPSMYKFIIYNACCFVNKPSKKSVKTVCTSAKRVLRQAQNNMKQIDKYPYINAKEQPAKNKETDKNGNFQQNSYKNQG